MVSLKRIEVVNKILTLIDRTPNTFFTLDRTANGSAVLRVENRHGRIKAALRSDKRWFSDSHAGFKLGVGGTMENFLVMMTLYIYDKPRLPISAIRGWCRNGLAKDDNLGAFDHLLKTTGFEYDTQEKCKCVVCGAYPIQRLDWFQIGSYYGPCCFGGQCDKDKYYKLIDKYAKD